MFSCLKVLKKSMIPQLCFIITLFTSGIIINLAQCILYLCLRPANKRLYRKINWYLCYAIFSQLVWLAEWWSGMNLIIYMDKNDFEKHVGEGHSFCIMNHTYEIEWLLTMILSDRMHLLGNFKTYSKKSLQYIPVIGWAGKFSEFIILERSFEKDKYVIKKQVKELMNYPDPVVLFLNPEGTRFTPEKHKASEEFARLNNMPSLKYHLQPRAGGFLTSLPPMRGKVPAIYDIILAFDENDPVKPTMLNLLLGESVTAYMYLKRIPMEDLPDSEDELRKFIQDMFARKDKLKESFIKTGDFFATSGVPKPTQLILKRRYCSLIIMIFCAILILCPMVYYIVGLLFSGSLLYCFFGIAIIGVFVGILYIVVALTKNKKGSSYGTRITNGSSHRINKNRII